MLANSVATSRSVVSVRTPGAFPCAPAALMAAFGVSARQSAVPFTGQAPLAVDRNAKLRGGTTVRKQHTYMTLVTAIGGGPMGPHRRRAPV